MFVLLVLFVLLYECECVFQREQYLFLNLQLLSISLRKFPPEWHIIKRMCEHTYSEPLHLVVVVSILFRMAVVARRKHLRTIPQKIVVVNHSTLLLFFLSHKFNKQTFQKTTTTTAAASKFGHINWRKMLLVWAKIGKKYQL